MLKIKLSSRIKKVAIVILIIVLTIVLAPILLLTVIACYKYGPIGILIVPVEIKVMFETYVNIHFFNKEIAPIVTAQITDPNVRFELHNFEEVMMPQFYISYSPNLDINFHTVIQSGKNLVASKHPLLIVSVTNSNTQKDCSFAFHDKHYDFLQEKPSSMSGKLLDLYHNRQIIIDDFVAEKPECFVQ